MADPSEDNDGQPDGEDLAAEWGAMVDDEDGDVDQDDLASEWDATAGDEDGADEMQVARVLNQDEIDSLLGFNEEDGDTAKSGIRAIINSALVSYERLPMLETADLHQ